MTDRVTINAILKEIGCDKLRLYRGRGYFYFTFDDGAKIFKERSVYVNSLDQMTIAQWAEQGRALVSEMEGTDNG